MAIACRRWILLSSERTAVSTFITRLDTDGSGPRVAVKDIIDVEGVPTTAGSRAVERKAAPAARDAACLAGSRAAGARLVGKANLHELALLPSGTNPWFGTPTKPRVPALVPGGASSGSAVAVADGEADVALGSDTGGSVRVPAACCGISGLKTTYGRVSLDGVWPLAPSLDTIGPMATSIAGLVLGMQLLEPGFAPAAGPAGRIGRLRTTGLPEIEAAVDEALRAAGLEVVNLDWDGFEMGGNCFTAIYFKEIWEVDHELVEADPDGVGADIAQTMGMVDLFRPGFDQAEAQVAAWRHELFALFDQVELLALPTLPIFPPRLEDVTEESLLPIVIDITRQVSLFNAAGTPCTAQPVQVRGSRLPASLQLVGPLGGDELLLATAATIEAATT
jgi:amidase